MSTLLSIFGRTAAAFLAGTVQALAEHLETRGRYHLAHAERCARGAAQIRDIAVGLVGKPATGDDDEPPADDAQRFQRGAVSYAPAAAAAGGSPAAPRPAASAVVDSEGEGEGDELPDLEAIADAAMGIGAAPPPAGPPAAGPLAP